MGDPGDEDTEVQSLPEPPVAVPRTFTPSTREELTDDALLPRRFRFLEGEVREMIGVMRRQLIPRLDVQSEVMGELRELLQEIRGELRRESAARGALEERVMELSIAVGLAR